MPDALIWGASGGIGQALVQTLKADGWRVLAAARRDDAIPDTADASAYFDAADPFSVNQAAMQLAQVTDGVELVVYAAGGIRANPLDKLNAEDWNAVLAANLTGVFLALQASLSLVSREASVMAIGAYTEKITLPRMAAYTAAKAALEPLMTIFQKENRKLKVTLVQAPAVNTAFWENVPFKMPEYALAPQAVAEAILAHHKAGGSGLLSL